DGIRDDLVTGVQTCALPIYPRLPRPAMNSRMRWRNKRPVRLARPFPRTASTVRETIVENASSTPWPVRALVRNMGAAGNSFRSRSEERRVGKEVRVGRGG